MSRMDRAKELKKLLEELRKGKKPKKSKKKAKKKEKEIDADVNDDGVVDEKDLEEVRKKIVKKK